MSDGPSFELLKIIICEVPTEDGNYADYKLIALFDSEITYLGGRAKGGETWRASVPGTLRRFQHDGTVTPLSMVASFIWLIAEAIRTSGIPPRMVISLLIC
jgi:hypothetical protein